MRFLNLLRDVRKKALILLYHRVAEPSNDPFDLAVSPEHFRQQMEFIHHRLNPITLSKLIANLNAGRCPHRGVVITFDDGYRDNFYEAEPILSRYQIPATLFVATGQIGVMEEFWWDRLQKMFFNSGHQSPSISISIAGKTYSWEFRDTIATQDNGESAKLKVDPDRERAFRQVHGILFRLDQATREAVMRDLYIALGRPEIRVQDLAMSRDELLTLANGDSFSLGAHTAGHTYLPTAPLAERQKEVMDCTQFLEGVTGQSVPHFSYPYGGVPENARSLMIDAGYEAAVTTIQGVVRASSDRYKLPRFTVQNWDRDQFEQRVSGWLENH